MPIVILISFIAALSGLLFGYDTGVISGVILFIGPKFKLSLLSTELIVSMVVFGACLGALLTGRVSDSYCRRHLLFTAALAFLLGSLCAALATSPSGLILGRFIIGLAIGISSYIAPLYIAEIAPAKYRGSLVTLNVVMITGGIVVAYMSNYALANLQNGWRFMLGLGALPAALLIASIKMLPPSPRWLIKQGKLAQAEQVLSQISETPKQTLASIQQHIQNTVSQPNWRSLLSGNNLRLVIMGCALSIMQQTSGINAILYYAPVLIKTAGFTSTQTQLLATIGIGLINFFMTIVALYLVERLGRRSLLLMGFCTMTVCLSQVSVGFYWQNWFSKWYLLANIIGFMIGYASSIGCVFWVIIAEIFPLQFRASAMSLATATNWLSNGLISLSFLSFLQAFGPGTVFLSFTLACLLSAIFCYLYVPETRGKTLEQIEARFNNSVDKG